ncbi:MAG: hypothetical protein KDC45_12120 [Bacteroidetes bacterium]|nr:hypothetical protein [Bacteroidota bacterium]
MKKELRRPWLHHVFSLSIIAVLFFVLGVLLSSDQTPPRVPGTLQPYLSSIDLSDPIQRAVLEDLLAEVQGDSAAEAFGAQLNSYRNDVQQFAVTSRNREDVWTLFHLLEVGRMIWIFGWSYLLVLALIHYGVETLAIYRFIRLDRKFFLADYIDHIKHLPASSEWIPWARGVVGFPLMKLLRGVCYVLLYSPAYVAAYALKGQVDTASFVLYLLLGTLTNGVLLIYTEKYFGLLVSESRKGYVDTARVKGLTHDRTVGVSFRWSEVFSMRKKFEAHTLGHLIPNVRNQYGSTFKEQASFLMTGLILVEMALNIQGRLGYEMLKQITYHNFDFVLLILFFLFFIVKLTQLITDSLANRRRMLYENTAH